MPRVLADFPGFWHIHCAPLPLASRAAPVISFSEITTVPRLSWKACNVPRSLFFLSLL